MLQQLNVVGDSCKQIHTCVREKGGYFEQQVMTFQFICD